MVFPFLLYLYKRVCSMFGMDKLARKKLIAGLGGILGAVVLVVCGFLIYGGIQGGTMAIRRSTMEIPRPNMTSAELEGFFDFPTNPIAIKQALVKYEQNREFYKGYFGKEYIEELAREEQIDSDTSLLLGMTVEEKIRLPNKAILIFRALAKRGTLAPPSEASPDVEPASKERDAKFYISLLSSLDVPGVEIRGKIFQAVKEIYVLYNRDKTKLDSTIRHEEVLLYPWVLSYILEATTWSSLGLETLERIDVALNEYLKEYERPSGEEPAATEESGVLETIVNRSHDLFSVAMVNISRLIFQNSLKKYEDFHNFITAEEKKDQTGALKNLMSNPAKYRSYAVMGFRNIDINLNNRPIEEIGLETIDFQLPDIIKANYYIECIHLATITREVCDKEELMKSLDIDM